MSIPGTRWTYIVDSALLVVVAMDQAPLSSARHCRLVTDLDEMVM